MKTEKVYTQHEENKEWMNSLLFYRDEIKIMENRLQEIASKNTSKEILAEVEHFQNQIIIQKDHIDQVKHEINLSNDRIQAEANKNSTAIDHRSIEDHTALRENVESFEKIFRSLKTELNIFLSKYM
jgi:predicted RNA-binding protein